MPFRVRSFSLLGYRGRPSNRSRWVDDDASQTLELTSTSPQEELNLPVSQALALFVKSIRKICKRLMDIQKSALEAELPPPPTSNGTGDQRTIKATEALEKMKPVEATIDDELREAGNEVTRELREKQREMINSLDLSK